MTEHSDEPAGQQPPLRIMLSCDICRKKKIRCNGAKPECSNCQRTKAECHYSPVGPRKKPRRQGRTGSQRADSLGSTSSGDSHRAKRRASSSQVGAGDPQTAGSAMSSVSHLMLERLRETEDLDLLSTEGAASGRSQQQQQQPPVMEMLRLQTQISTLVDQLRTLTIRVSGMNSPRPMSPLATPDGVLPPPVFEETQSSPSLFQTAPSQKRKDSDGPRVSEPECTHMRDCQLPPSSARSTHTTPPSRPMLPTQCCQQQQPATPNIRVTKAENEPSSGGGLNVSRDLITHLISVYFEYGHPTETGMYPMELYRERLLRAQVSEPFLLSTLAVASRFSDDPRVQKEPAYLAGYEFFERVTRGMMMDVIERDSVENMLTLNNLAVFAVGLPVANRGWYFSGLAMRMTTQMSLQKVDAPGRMPGASMMSGAGIESARRAFWTTLLLEALASFASGEPPPITIQDIHVAEPYDDPSMLGDDPAAAGTAGSSTAERSDNERSSADDSVQQRANVSSYIAQLSMFLIRVARLNGNRHPESAQFSPEYAALHTEMVGWYHRLPDNMQVRSTTTQKEISTDPRQFAAKMFVHCHYQAAIIALHQPRVDLVRVESTNSNGTSDGDSATASGQQSADQQQWRRLAQQQCLTASCTMTELLCVARALDVRYHIVTFGFAVFMAGVVHVGAVACTPRGSTERQYSVNCVREHVRCLDRLGKYFAFHFIMAKHIRAQLQTIEATDLRRQQQHATEFQQRQQHAAVAAAALAGVSSPLQSQMGTFGSPQTSGIDAFGLGARSSNGTIPLDVTAALGIIDPGMLAQDTSSSVDMFLGMIGASSESGSRSGTASAAPQTQARCPGPAVCAGLCGTHSPRTTASMLSGLQQGMAGMAGLGTGISSLVELFSSTTSSDGTASLYPEKLVSSSSLAPSQKNLSSPQITATTAAARQTPPTPSSYGRADLAAPLRLTSPGGLQQYGSLPPL
ncbi:hypothetical protein GGF46_005410 [Coemansia sp. RSA 552]|nr:hypothetical protein GGF46_005410 [Coemansia sp. RSA 552]